MRKREMYKDEELRKYIYIFSVTLILSIVVFLTVFVMYNKKLKREASESLSNLGSASSSIEDIVSNENLEETSFSSDLSIVDMTKNTQNTTNRTKISKEPVEAKVLNTTKENTNTITNTVNSEVNNMIKEEVVKELKFEAPVSGEIIKDFATDSLIYSNTLEEWTTHSGIDIKADKTSIVKSSEAGKIESIKNDPRYGLTITINHENGFKTIYSSLLSSDFVKVGDKVEKGDTIGTVGDSANFEIADDSHLHFEMYKDGKQVNPTLYLK